MSKKKKLLAMTASYVLVAALAIGGTIAYFTDTDDDVNVMTVGNVDITQIEQDRDGNDFKQGQMLMPNVTPTTEKDAKGYPASENYIDKIVTVKNEGKNDAYVRTFIAMPTYTYEGQDAEGAYDNVLHWNGYSQGDKAPKYPVAEMIPGTDETVTNNWYWGKEGTSPWPGNGGDWNSFEATIDGQAYTVYVVTHVTALEAGEITAPNMTGVYLDSMVDYDGKNYTYEGNVINGLDGTVEVLVATQAVQTDGFDDAWAALDAAFEAPSATNHPWVDGVETPAIVSTNDELADAISNGGTIYLNEGDYTIPSTLSDISLIANENNVNIAITPNTTANKHAVVLGDNVTIKGINFADDGTNSGKGDSALINVKGEDVVIEDCTFDITGTNSTAVALGGGSVNTLITGCDFVGGYKHIGPASGTTEGITIEDCSFTGANSTYAIHLNATANDVIVKDCDIALFNTLFGHGNDAGALIFENCNFIVEEGKTNVVKLYRDAEFINCTFEDGFLFSDANKDLTLKFKGGSWGEGTILDHFLADSFGYNITLTCDGVTYYWDTNVDKWIAQ